MKMNTIPYIVALIVVIALFTAKVRASVEVRYVEHDLDIGHLITAIKTVEAWDGRTPGKLGEWGPMQMRPAIYKQYANDERAYIRQLIKECVRLHRRPGAWIIGLLHNAGYPAVRDGVTLAAKLSFAERVENVYNELNR